MKPLLYLFLVLVLFGCEGIFDDTTHFSMTAKQSKEYPVYLDMCETGNIQVKANSPHAEVKINKIGWQVSGRIK